MKINIDYIKGETSSSSLGIDKIIFNLTFILKNEVNFKRYSYPIIRNRLLRQIYIYFLYPLKLWYLFHNSKEIIHISSQGYAHLAHFFPRDKLIITCCDIIPFIFPENKFFIQRMLLNFTFSGLKKAKKIIAISNSTKNDLIRYLHIPKEKIKVIYPGILKDFKPLNIKKKNFILYVGAYYKSKNLTVLFKSFLKISKIYPNLRLVIVNDKNNLPKELSLLMNNLHLSDKIDFTGNISEKTLIRLYNQAKLLIHPSIYEGFGLPVLEAMACGCPVLTSNKSSLSEVVGNAGIVVNPNDINGFIEGIKEIIANNKLKKELVKRGLKQAQKFYWLRTANETLKIYKDI